MYVIVTRYLPRWRNSPQPLVPENFPETGPRPADSRPGHIALPFRPTDAGLTERDDLLPNCPAIGMVLPPVVEEGAASVKQRKPQMMPRHCPPRLRLRVQGTPLALPSRNRFILTKPYYFSTFFQLCI